MAQSAAPAGDWQTPRHGTCDDWKPLAGMGIMTRMGVSAAGILRVPPALSFYHDNDSLGLRTALILTIFLSVSSFVTQQSRRRS